MLLNILAGLAALLAAVIVIAWLGTRVGGHGFTIPPYESRDFGRIAPVDGLPRPVARYCHAALGGELPVVQTALVMGTAKLTFNGITFPARFKFYYDVGNAYYHHIQLLWFGLPVITVHERFKDGIATLHLPGNLIENNRQTNAAALLGLSAEAVWFPAAFFTDRRVCWEPVDENTARMVVAGADDEESFTVRFDPATGLIADLTTLRYQKLDSETRTPWINRALEWGEFDGVRVPVVAELQWGSDAPWATWKVEKILYNVDVSARLAEFGGEVSLGAPR